MECSRTGAYSPCCPKSLNGRIFYSNGNYLYEPIAAEGNVPLWERENSNVKNARIKGWSTFFSNPDTVVVAEGYLSQFQDLLDEKEIKQARINGWCELFLSFPVVAEDEIHKHSDLLNEEKIKQAQIEGWRRKFYEFPELAEDICPDYLLEIECINKARIEGWKNKFFNFLDVGEANLQHFPNILDSKEISQARIDAWTSQLPTNKFVGFLTQQDEFLKGNRSAEELPEDIKNNILK